MGDTPSECFGYPERVVLENLPSLSTVILEKAFQYVNDISVSNFLSSSYKKSVSICEANELLVTDPTVTHLTVNSNCLNEVNEFQLNRFVVLKELVIGSNSLNDVVSLKLIGLNKLKRVVIGKNSFTKKKSNYGYDPNRHFYLKNCESLRELKMGRYSFSDYSVCEIENLPSLEVIEMGELNEGSRNFYHASKLELKSGSERMK